MPLLYCDISLPWSDTVHAYDACLSGYGVTCATSDKGSLGAVGRQREKFRFAGGATMTGAGPRLAFAAEDVDVSDATHLLVRPV